MELDASIQQAQRLSQQIHSLVGDSEPKLSRLIAELSDTIQLIEHNASQLHSQLNELKQQADDDHADTTSGSSKPETKNGCYVFAGEKGYFCPMCYDNTATKAPTTRINSRIRVCTVCRATLK